MRAALFFTPILVVACGGSLMDEPLPAPTQPAAVAPVAKKPPAGSLFRQDVNATVEEGLGYFLQRVSVDPEIVGGKFQGFRIVELRPMDYWQGVDLKPGDVVQKVNGQSIERDIDAYKAFQGLLAAPSLRVSFTRSGSPREIVYSIVDDPSRKRLAPAAPAPTEKPAPAAKPSSAG